MRVHVYVSVCVRERVGALVCVCDGEKESDAAIVYGRVI